MDEDPELRADDSVLIDLTPTELAGPDNFNQNNANVNVNGTGGANGQGGVNAAGGGNGSPNLNNIAGVLNGNGVPTGVGTNNNGNGSVNGANRDNSKEQPPKTEEEKKKIEEFRKRILSGNPYKLNHLGVLEIPGMPAIPLAGLTAFEATMRLRADSQLSTDYVRKTHTVAPCALRRRGAET